MKPWMIILPIYFALSVLSYAAQIASDQWYCENRLIFGCDSHMVRRDQARALFAFVPVAGWFGIAATTGGWQDGISFTRTPNDKSRY